MKYVSQHSKTNKAVREETILLKSIHKLVFNHIIFAVEAKVSGDIFVIFFGVPLTRRIVVSVLKMLLKKTFLKTKVYKTHIFPIGL